MTFASSIVPRSRKITIFLCMIACLIGLLTVSIYRTYQHRYYGKTSVCRGADRQRLGRQEG